MTTPDDDLRNRLHGAADSIDAGDLSLDDVRATARRRTTRTRAGALVGVLGLVAAGVVAVVATNSSDDPGTLVSADPTVPESPETTLAIEDTTTTLPESTTPGVTVEVIQRPAAVGQPAGLGGAPDYGEWVAPWRDGFLVGAQVWEPQPLPAELPEEIVALFPPEVVELFDGQLPPTISEATDMLSEAGLLDVVADIIAANPEASDAIYSAPVDDEPTLDVRFTTDGVTWEPVEMTSPPGATYLYGIATVGDRLAVAYTTTDPLTGMNLDGIVRVATSADLVTWDVQEVIVPPPPVAFPAGINWSTNVVSFAVNESGWVVSVHGGANVNPEALLPPEVRAEFAETEYGLYTDDEGVVVERFETGGVETDVDVGPDVVETDRYTWEELGVAPEVIPYLSYERPFEPALWSSTWGGTPTEAGFDTGFGQLVATSAGFLRVGDDVRFSPDGITWILVELPFDDGFVSGSFTFDGGVVLVVSDFGPDGAEFYRVDDTGGSPVLLDLPGLPEDVQSGSSPSGREVLVLDAGDRGPPLTPFVVEFEGYRLTIDNWTAGIEVVELATGDVVGEANMRDFGSDTDSNVVLDETGVTVTDPTSGEVIVAIPTEVLEAASDEVYEESETVEYSPDSWLLASRDGERFLLIDLDDGPSGEFIGIGAMASNGTKVLVQFGDEWVVYDLP